MEDACDWNEPRGNSNLLNAQCFKAATLESDEAGRLCELRHLESTFQNKVLVAAILKFSC